MRCWNENQLKWVWWFMTNATLGHSIMHSNQSAELQRRRALFWCNLQSPCWDYLKKILKLLIFCYEKLLIQNYIILITRSNTIVNKRGLVKEILRTFELFLRSQDRKCYVLYCRLDFDFLPWDWKAAAQATTLLKTSSYNPWGKRSSLLTILRITNISGISSCVLG